MGPIVLLKNFTFALDDTDVFTTDWVPFPSEHQNATLHVHLQTLTPGNPSTGAQFSLATSYDTVEAEQVGTTVAMTAPGVGNAAISSNLGPMVRAVITNGESNAIWGTVSIWLQPKSE